MLLVAAGLDPEVCTLFVQSHVPEHAQLGWLMECTAAYGELRRMTQFKEKGEPGRVHLGGAVHLSRRSRRPTSSCTTPTGCPWATTSASTSSSARDVAIRFNSRYGDTFVVPEHAIPPGRRADHGPPGPDPEDVEVDRLPPGHRARPRPARRRSRRRSSGPSPTTTARSATTPPPSPASPTCSSILGAVTGGEPGALAERYEQYGPLKADVAEALVEALRPLQERFAELSADPAEVDRVIAAGRREGPGHRRRPPWPGPWRPSGSCPARARRSVVVARPSARRRRTVAATTGPGAGGARGSRPRSAGRSRPASRRSAPMASWRR